MSNLHDRLAAALARIPNHLTVKAWTQKGARLRVEAREKIEIDKAVIERRHDRVGMRMSEARQMRIGARTVDDDKMTVGERLQCPREILSLGAARFFAAVDR